MKLFKTKNKKNLPLFDSNQKALHKNLEFTAIEQYKLVRTNLDFTLPEGEKCPVIGVTSPMRAEGKSTTAINLSYVLAERGSKVLLLDGDLRIPSIAKKMEIKMSPGLTDLLMNKSPMQMSDYQSPLLSNWYIMPSGDIPPNPSELLSSRRMEAALKVLKEYFDYIIIDLPPANIVSDAIAIAKFITGMVVVVREDATEKKELDRCFRQLKLSNVKVLGCVMNETKSGGGSYGKYKKYKYYKYYRTYQSEPKDDKS